MATSPFGGGTFTPDPVQAFLHRVVAWSLADPPDSYVNVHAFGGTIATPFRGGGRAFAGPEGPAEAQSFVDYLNRIEAEVFFCCAAVNDYDREHSVRYLRALRKGIKPVWYKSLVLDLDVKPDRYSSQRQALAAWLPFCAQIGLLPGPIVSTGTGIHAYIAFDQPVVPELRNNLARRLVAAAQAHGLKADWGVTTDPVRILRMPTSFNRKDPNNLAECRVLDLGTTMTAEAVVTALQNYSPVRAEYRRPNGNGIDLSHLGPPPKNMPPVDPQEADRAQADLEQSREATSVELVAGECPLVRRSLSEGGATDHEPLWYVHAKLCHYLQDGRDAFHWLSFKHSDYDEADADDKFDKVEALGWPHCTTFEQTGPEAAEVCKACPHYGKGKSPIHFAVRSKVNGSATTYADGVDTPIIFRTEKIHRDDDGYIVSNEDGKRAFTVPIYDVQVISVAGDAHLRVDFDSRTSDVGGRTHAEIPIGIIQNQKEFLKVTGNRLLTSKNPKLAMETCMDWATTIQQSRLVFQQNKNGWIMPTPGQITGFAACGHTFDQAGAHRMPGHQPDAPVGTLDNWKKAIGPLIGKGYTEVEILIATAFAAPLVIFTMVDGLVVHARSSGSGKGKSAAIEIAQSVWSKRKARVQNTTLNSINQKMTDLNNLPLYVDEMLTEEDRGVRGRNFAKLILDASSGSGRDRLTQRGTQQARGECCTIMVSAANMSLVQSSSGRDTNAQAARVLEIPMPNLGQNAMPEEVAVGKHLLDSNFGVAAVVYCAVLGMKHEGLKQLVLDVMKELRIEIGNYQHDERYWLAAITTILVGARLAKALELVDFDIVAMKRKLLEIYRNQRVVVKDMNVDADDPATQLYRIGQFLNDKIRNRIITDAMPKKGNPGKMMVHNSQYIFGVNEFVARYAIKEQLLWVSEAKLKAYSHDRWSYEQMRATLLQHHYCIRNSKNQRTIGGGCGEQFTGAKEIVLEFDLSLACNEPLRLTGETDV